MPRRNHRGGSRGEPLGPGKISNLLEDIERNRPAAQAEESVPDDWDLWPSGRVRRSQPQPPTLTSSAVPVHTPNTMSARDRKGRQADAKAAMKNKGGKPKANKQR